MGVLWEPKSEVRILRRREDRGFGYVGMQRGFLGGVRHPRGDEGLAEGFGVGTVQPLKIIFHAEVFRYLPTGDRQPIA